MYEILHYFVLHSRSEHLQGRIHLFRLGLNRSICMYDQLSFMSPIFFFRGVPSLVDLGLTSCTERFYWSKNYLTTVPLFCSKGYLIFSVPCRYFTLYTGNKLRTRLFFWTFLRKLCLFKHILDL